jgi:two-component system NtrC family response regulator
MTGHAERQLAVEAIARGAWDFLGKPIDPELLRIVIERALVKRRLEQELSQWRTRAEADDETMGLLGASAAMRDLRTLVRRIAPTEVSVTITGPSGTGKELVARALHAQSKRTGRPFVPVHCGAIPSELFESELFGHLKGSFTGADRDRPGLIASADGGTLFLDEIGEMPLSMQVKLLRFLQQGSFYPVGAHVEKQVNVRVVAATNRDLGQMVEEKTFRDDLYYRLRGIQLRTPALAERSEDIAIIAQAFAVRQAPPKRLAAEALAWLGQQNWTGNVRELQQAMQTAAALAADRPAIELDDLMLACGVAEAPPTEPDASSLDGQLAALEKRLIIEALALTGHNHTHAARHLGISRVGLLKKMSRHALR